MGIGTVGFTCGPPAIVGIVHGVSIVVIAVALGGCLNLTLDVVEAGGVGLQACSLLSNACSMALANKSNDAGSVFGEGPNIRGGAAWP